MGSERKFNFKIYLRAIVAIIMLIAWVLVSISGIVLWLAPEGPRSGRVPLLLELTKNDWRDVHLWLVVIVCVITLIHVIIDWKALVGVVKYLVSVHREQVKNLF